MLKYNTLKLRIARSYVSNYTFLLLLWLYCPLLGLGRWLRFLSLYTLGRTLCKAVQSVVKPLPTHRTSQNKRTHRHLCLEWDANSWPQLLSPGEWFRGPCVRFWGNLQKGKYVSNVPKTEGHMERWHTAEDGVAHSYLWIVSVAYVYMQTYVEPAWLPGTSAFGAAFQERALLEFSGAQTSLYSQCSSPLRIAFVKAELENANRCFR
jgi:hypothetical protein